MKRTDLVLSLGQRLLLLLCFFLICYILTMVCSYILGVALAGRAATALRISALLQDILAFIVPAVGTAVLVSRRPAELLCITTPPRLTLILLVVAILFVSIPAQETIIYWNYNISLPESMAGLEQTFRTLENMAADTLKTMMTDTSIGALILNILIVGIAAGVAEELLFRGCFQRLLVTGGVNVHLAIWLVAICFSAMHMQIFGFVPRMLLGAYFGYLLLWSGSVWVPVTAHVLNNTMFVVTAWHQVRQGGIDAVSQEPTLWGFLPTTLSLLLTAATLYLIYSTAKSHIGQTKD